MTRTPDERANSTTQTRRRFLQAVAAGGIAGGIGLTGARAQETTLEFGGQRSGWVGRAPAAIEGQTNPTLQLEAGRTYTVRWENVDGLPHNFAFLDPDGNSIPVIQTDDGAVAETEIVSQRGATQEFQFVAEPAIATYFCVVHPNSMRGGVEVRGGGATTTAGEETTQRPERFVPRGPTVGLQQVAGDPIQQPVGFAVADEDRDRRFVVDQNGQIYVHGPDGIESEPFLDVQEKLVSLRSDFDERGLLGLAFHPEFQDNGRFFVRYSAPLRPEDFVGPDREGTPKDFDHTFVLSEYQTTDDGSAARPDSERILLEIPEPQFNHNAGDLAFGPDGYLYVAVGDGGGANDSDMGHVPDWYDDNEGGNGQDVTENLLGSILRIDVDNEEDGRRYAIPDDNPLVGTDAFPEHYAWGLRNPWRMSFNDGELFVADVGQNLFEEVNIVERGGNYGWNVKEATHCFSPASPDEPPENCPDSTPDGVRGGEPLIDPVIEYPHTFQNQSVGISVTGGYVAQSDTVGELQSRYVFGDWSRSFSEPRGRLFVATRPEAGETETAEETTTDTAQAGDGDGLWSFEELVVENSPNGEVNRFVLAFGRDRNGDLYVCTSETPSVSGSGSVYKIVPPGEGDQISPPVQATTTAGETTTGGGETTTSDGEATTVEETTSAPETTEESG
ncbi:PQQ-dependent sugar dehydrogenase [Halorussus halophilus]|uniref:PQQ-dependent sugar dehydrogenase n=1 Tax=Halorussus halophilus TaxID=2650975 RepID=UPI0013015FB2|nr:PQQ-dependent sugar dehydrogenase [Halorussus halophilus]